MSYINRKWREQVSRDASGPENEWNYVLSQKCPALIEGGGDKSALMPVVPRMKWNYALSQKCPALN